MTEATKKQPAPKDEEKKRDMDAPFTRAEKIKWTFVLLLIPWFFYLPVLYAGGYWRTYPKPPRFPGLVLAPIILSVAYLGFWFLLVDHPRVLRERATKSEFSKDKPGEPWQESLAQNLIILNVLAMLVGSPYDAAGRALNDKNQSVALYVFGSVSFLVSIGLIAWVLRVNKFASNVVYKQIGQQLITSGPYATVRHPFYSFMVFFFLGFPLTIGSPVWGLIASFVNIPILMWRTFHEEDFLVAEFGQEYQDFRERVPYRMFPGIF